MRTMAIIRIDMRGHPSKTSGRRGGCVCANDGGGGVGHQPDVHRFFLRFGSPYWSFTEDSFLASSDMLTDPSRDV